MLARRRNSRPPFPLPNNLGAVITAGQAGQRPACVRCLYRPTANNARSIPATQQSPEHTHHVESLLIRF